MILGFDPMVQVVHERDVLRAIVLALAPNRRGIYNIRGPGELPLSRAFQMIGKQPVFWPASLAKRALNGLWRSGITNFPAPELDHVRYVCMVDDARARSSLGYVHQHDIQQTLDAVFEEW
jgi:UDP-glucose 4-epimerase